MLLHSFEKVFFLLLLGAAKRQAIEMERGFLQSAGSFPSICGVSL